MRTISRIISLLVFPLALAGCWGGGSGSSPNEQSGRFVDSPVSGLQYYVEDPASYALTDEQGGFKYRSGETLTFSLGRLVLGSAPGSSVITLRSLFGVPLSADLPDAAINIARLLLTLDTDADPSNGIQIAQETLDQFSPSRLSQLAKLDFDVAPEDFESNAKVDTKGDAEILSDYEKLLQLHAGAGRNNQLASAIEAEEHIMCSEQDIANGAEPDGSCVTGQKPEISIEDVAVSENAGSATLTVMRGGNTAQAVIIEYATTSVVSDASDFTSVVGTLNFPAGVTSQIVSIPVIDDQLQEPVETIQLMLSSTNDLIFIRDYANISILDDDSNDPNPTYNSSVSLAKTSEILHIVEGDFGTTPVRLMVRRSGDLEPALKAQFSTVQVNGASAGLDYYEVTDGNIEFLPGQVEKLVTVRVRGDKLVDPEEQFAIRLTAVSAATNVTATRDIRPVTIEIDDDDFVDPDPDKDGLDNDEEEALGTDPNDPDTDDDGANDKDDLFPLDPNEQADDDGDGVGNNADSDDDNDGVLDVDDQCPGTATDDSNIDTNGCGDNQRNDDDQDGVHNGVDQCANTPSSDLDVDGNGCGESQRDSDNDSVADNLDSCPNTPEGDSNIDALGCGDSQRDSDGDDVSDNLDACPNTPDTDISIDERGCGESQRDSDNDGLNDKEDLCPLVASTNNSDSDGDGVGDVCDEDDDNDGVADSDDVCPATQSDEVNDIGCSAEQLPVVTMSAAAQSVNEADGIVGVVIRLDNPAVAETMVVLSLDDITAEGLGVDYGTDSDVLVDQNQPGAWAYGVVFAEGETSQTLDININNDSDTEFLETFSANLLEADYATVGAADSTEISIIDDETLAVAVKVGASKKPVDPTVEHVNGVEEARLGVTNHKQKFNLGGFGIDPLQNFPDPIGSAGDDNPFGQTLTQPVEQPCLVRDQANYDGDTFNAETDCVERTWVRAMVIETPEAREQVAFVVLDAVGAGNVIQKKVRLAITTATGISSDNIIFGQTHTHAGADLQGLWGGVPQDWIDNTLVVQAANAVAEAVATLEPVELTVAQGDMSDFNRYRRPRQTNPDAETDVLGTLLTATSLQQQGKVVAHLMQFSAHPVSVDEDPRIPHPDYPLGVVETLEQDNSIALYFNGPIADASTEGNGAPCAVNPDYDLNQASAYQGAHCRGEGMAEAAQGFDNPKPLAATVNVKNQEVYLPVTNPLFVGGGLLGAFNKYYDFTESNQYTDQIPELGEQARFLPQLAPYAITNVTRITIGGAESGLEIVTIPGETTGTFGGWVRGLPNAGATTMLLGLTQNSFGYIIPEEEFRYIDASGDDGFTAPFTGYEEFVSLGPLTAPLLRMEGYLPLFDIDAPSPEYLPDYLVACQDDPSSRECLFSMVGFNIDYVQSSYANQCREMGGEEAEQLCALFDPETPVAEQCITLGGPEGLCSVFGDTTNQPAPSEGGTPVDLVTASLDAVIRGCDLLDPTHCMYPFPSNHFTTDAPAGSPQHASNGGTGLRVDFNPLSTPRNLAGKPVDPREWNRNDGFSPGQMLVTYVPNLSLEQTHGLHSDQIGFANPQLSLASDASIQVFEVSDDGQGGITVMPHLVWAEMDVNADLLAPDPCRNAGGQVDEGASGEFCDGVGAGDLQRPVAGKSALLIRPAQNFAEGKRYVAVLRNLRDTNGDLISPQATFAECLAEGDSVSPPIADRCDEWKANVLPAVEQVLDEDDQLYLAWDFTIASTQNNIGRLRHMRDDAFGENCNEFGADLAQCTAPEFSIDRVVTEGLKTGIAKRIEGVIRVPSYVVPADPSPLERAELQQAIKAIETEFPDEFEALFEGVDVVEGGSLPPNRLFFDPSQNVNPADPAGLPYGDGLPDSVTTMDTRFICQIPDKASEASPARAGVYGHGLLDGRGAVNYDGVPEISADHNFMFCTVDWFGFATGDIANVASVLVDISNFAVIPDSSQQGILNFLHLARLLADADDGFASDSEFQDAEGNPLFDTSEVFYDGNSQGGILGGVVTAVSPDIQRGVLGALGMNYSTLLRRSKDFDFYAIPLYLSYPDELDRNVLLSMMQMLWDRSENNGYAHHINDNSAFGGPHKDVLLHGEFGDHEVTQWSADAMARTVGMPVDQQQVERTRLQLGQAKRHPDVVPYFDFEPLDHSDELQISGSAHVIWDMNNEAGRGEAADIPPITNTPPRTGRNPHDDPAKSPRGRCQKNHFLQSGGYIVDVIRGADYTDKVTPVSSAADCNSAFGVVLTGDASRVDSDGDGLSDAEENQLGTNPNDADSDNDGVNDGDEVAAGTDPLNADSDGDSVEDGADSCPATPEGESVDGNGCSQSQLDDDSDGVTNNLDLCPGTPSDESANSEGCSESQLTHASCSQGLALEGGREYQVTLTTHDEQTLSFQVMEPINGIGCGEAGIGAHPLLMHGPGYGGTRSTSGFSNYREDGFTVISWDPRGFGDTTGSVRGMDPEFEGQYLVQILDWAESNLDYLSWRDESDGSYVARPQSASSEAAGINLVVGAIGGSYGGGYQMLTLVADDKKRLDAIIPDITWHDLRNALNPGDVVKTTWGLALAAMGTASGSADAGNPLTESQDPFIQETVARSSATNEWPRQSLDWFEYRGGLGAWCKASGLPSMPYPAYSSDVVPMIDASNSDNTPEEQVNGRPGYGDYLVQPEDANNYFEGLDVLITQGMIDTLFHFNEAWWNNLCLSAAGANVSVSTHNGGHVLPGAQSPDKIPTDTNSCSPDSNAWLNARLLPNAPSYDIDGACFALGASGDAVTLAKGDVLAPMANTRFTQRAVNPIAPVPNGVPGGANTSGNAAIYAPLGLVENEGVLAGMPHASLTVASLGGVNEAVQDCSQTLIDNSPGCDSIIFVGVGVKKVGGLQNGASPSYVLIDDQVQPLRGLGVHEVDLVGIAERVKPGDELALLFYANHPQFFGSISRDASIPAVNVSGTVSLPLYAVDSNGQPDPEADAETVLAGEPPVLGCTADQSGSFVALTGALHEHSGFSDGSIGTTPADYFAAGKAKNLDFMGSSEHSDNSRLPVTANQDCASEQLIECFQSPPEGLLKWENTATMASAASDEIYTAFRGFEWTSDRFGHANVFFSTNDWNAKAGVGYTATMELFWQWFIAPASIGGGDDGLLSFNHPGREDTVQAVINSDPAYTFNDFRYVAAADQRAVGVEVFGKSDYYDDGGPASHNGSWYAYALDKGWHLGPIGSEDHHDQRWGDADLPKTVILARENTPADIKEAMLARRFYAVAQNFNNVEVSFFANGLPMGSRQAIGFGAELVMAVSVVNVANPTIELVGPRGQVLHSEQGSTLNVTEAVFRQSEQWRFVRVKSDGQVVAITAPVWFRASGTPYPECDVVDSGEQSPLDQLGEAGGLLNDVTNPVIGVVDELVEQCEESGLPAELCESGSALSEGIEDLLGGGDVVDPGPIQQAKAGASIVDASWHFGASAGQFSETGHGVDGGRGYDPYSHSTRKVGSDTLGTRIQVRAITVEGDNGKRIAVVANDLYLPNDFTRRRVVQLLAEHDALAALNGGTVTGITEENLAMTVSHSHTSPFYSTPAVGPWVFQDVYDVRFHDYIAQQMATALINATKDEREVTMGATAVYANDVRGHTYSPTISNEQSTPNTPAGQPRDYTTRQMYVVKFDNLADGKNYANWVVLGVHPEWVWGEEIVNGDLTHATMSMLDRETGAITVMSQSETGTGGPHKDERAHTGSERREFQESNQAGAARAARYVANNVKDALHNIETANAWDADQHAEEVTNFRVDFAYARFAPPGARPTPQASNCNADSIYYDGNPDIVVPELPECNQELSPIIEPFEATFGMGLGDAIGPVVDELKAQGVPVPHSYGIPSYGLLEEGATVPIQAFKLGEVAVTFCPCEQFTDTALNVISRLNKVEGDIHTGWDWATGYQRNDGSLAPGMAGYSAWLRNPATNGDFDHANASLGHVNLNPEQQLYDIGCDVGEDTVSCTDPQDHLKFNSGKAPITMTRAAYDRMQAQIHNDAAGWEALTYALDAEAEPNEVSEIKGNFTHEEFPERGYGLVIPVGMANDYWGYMPAYREYRAHDHYRKSLAGLGPHGADFLATRMARLADQLNGGEGMPLSAKDQAYLAEDARQEAFTRLVGELGRAANFVYPLTLPADGGEVGVVVAPLDIERFDAATVRWVGGNTWLGMPEVVVERCFDTDNNGCDEGDWHTYGDMMGDVQLHVSFPEGLSLGDLEDPTGALGSAPLTAPLSEDMLMWRAGQFEWQWTAAFEAYASEVSMPDINGATQPSGFATPTGRYRFVISGQKQGVVGQVENYSFETDSFEVKPWSGLTVEHAQPGAEIDYPDTWLSERNGEGSAIPWVRQERKTHTYRGVEEEYCHRCSFRPWQDKGEVVAVNSVTDGNDIYIEAGGIVDEFDNTNGECIDLSGDFCATGGGIDSDNDGLTDKQEIALGTNPFDADSDDDGILDGADALPLDNDNDGVTDANDLCADTGNVSVDEFGCPVLSAQLKAGTAQGPLPIPVGTPLGGYLRPPIGGEYVPALEAFGEADPMPFFEELLDFVPTHQDHDGVPIAPVPDEARTAHSPYANLSPPTHGYYDSLITKAIALENDGNHIVMVKMDFIGMIDEFVVDVEAEVESRTGIALGDGLIMSGTHTHDGPGALLNHSMRALWVAMDVFQPELYDRVISSVADVVEAALADMKPARFGYASGVDTTGSNKYRRNHDAYLAEDAAVRSSPAKRDELRKRIGVMRLDELNPSTGDVVGPMAMVVNYSAHGIAFDVENLFFSGDVMGSVEREVAQQFDQPVMVMSVQSAGGDVSPSIDRDMKLQGIEKFGKKLAPVIKTIFDDVNNFTASPTLKAVSKRIVLSQETLGYSNDEYPYPWGAFQCGTAEQLPGACLAMPAPDPDDLADNGVAENKAWGPGDTRLAAAQIGDLVLLAQPGEALTEYGVRLLNDMEDRGLNRNDVFIWGTSQDHIGYLLPAVKADWERGGTEGTTTFWGWKLATRLRTVYGELASALAGGLAPENEFEVAYTNWPAVPAVAKPSARPGRVITQAEDIQRFETTTFSWEGGDPVIDFPRVVMERLDGEDWVPALRGNGDEVEGLFEMHLEYQYSTAAHQWIVTFEAPLDWPAGMYRIAASGTALQLGEAPYLAVSNSFQVSPATNLLVTAAEETGETRATFSYHAKPDNYRVIDAESKVTQLQPVRTGVLIFTDINGVEASDETVDITVEGQRIVANYAVDLTSVVSIRGVDQWGNSGAYLAGGEPVVDNVASPTHDSLVNCFVQQDPDLCAGALSDLAALQDCPLDESGFACAFNVAYDTLGADHALGLIQGIVDQCTNFPTEPVCEGVYSMGNGAVPDRLPLGSKLVARGELIKWPEFATPAKSMGWKGISSQIGGTSVYSHGEHVYQDFLYDAWGADDGADARRIAATALAASLNDRVERLDVLAQAAGAQFGAPGPVGVEEHYGDVGDLRSGADISEVRWTSDGTDLRLQVRYTSLTDAADANVVVLADYANGGNNSAVESLNLVTGRFDRAITLSQAAGNATVNSDGYSNTLDATISKSLLMAAGDPILRVAVVAVEDGKITNVAYRPSEPVAIYNDRNQALALLAGNIDEFVARIEVDKLETGYNEAVMPGVGYHERVFISGADISKEHKQETVLQRYGLYIPSGYYSEITDYAPPLENAASRLTVWMHYRGGSAHSGGAWTPKLIHQLGEEQNNVVITPHGRGTSLWYTGRSHQDVWEVLADTVGADFGGVDKLSADHAFSDDGLLNIDTNHIYISGYSMGGYGTWLFGMLYPDKFAAGFTQSGPVTQGAWTGLGPDDEQCRAEAQDIPEVGNGNLCFVEANDGRADAQLMFRVLENAQHMPIAIHHGTNDELAIPPQVYIAANRLRDLGYRYDFLSFLGYEHFTQAIVDEWVDGAEYLNKFRNPDAPREITYKVVPAMVDALNNMSRTGHTNSSLGFDFSPDGAWWVDDMQVAGAANNLDNPNHAGQVSAVSYALAGETLLAVPRLADENLEHQTPWVTTPALSPGGHSTPFVRQGQDWLPVGQEALSNGFTLELSDVESLSLDTQMMALDFDSAIAGSANSNQPVMVFLKNISTTQDLLVYVNGQLDGAISAGETEYQLMLAVGESNIHIGSEGPENGFPSIDDAAWAPNLGDVCADYGSAGAPSICGPIVELQDQLQAQCEMQGFSGAQCSLTGLNVHALTDACYEYAPDPQGVPTPGSPLGGEAQTDVCKAVDTFMLAAAAYCRPIGEASNGVLAESVCALVGGYHVGDNEVAQFQQTKTFEQLSLQYDLMAQRGLPMAQWWFPSTHNSFNSTSSNTPPTLSGSDANQLFTLVQQLDMGVRGVEIDVHYMPSLLDGGFRPTVCHGNTQHFGCSIEKSLETELSALNTWLLDNPDQVIVIDLEDNMNQDIDQVGGSFNDPYEQARQMIEVTIGDRIYTREDHGAVACDSGQPLSATIDNIRSEGKQVVVYSSGCGKAWGGYLFTRDNTHRQSGAGTFIGKQAGMDCGIGSVTDGQWTRVYEDATLVGRVATDTARLHNAQEVSEMAKCGINMPSLDYIHPNDPRMQAFVWGWEDNQPSSSGDCAVLNATGRMEAVSCASIPALRACLASNGSWSAKIDCGGDMFSVPANGQEMFRLVEAANGNEVALNYRKGSLGWMLQGVGSPL